MQIPLVAFSALIVGTVVVIAGAVVATFFITKAAYETTTTAAQQLPSGESFPLIIIGCFELGGLVGFENYIVNFRF